MKSGKFKVEENASPNWNTNPPYKTAKEEEEEEVLVRKKIQFDINSFVSSLSTT